MVNLGTDVWNICASTIQCALSWCLCFRAWQRRSEENRPVLHPHYQLYLFICSFCEPSLLSSKYNGECSPHSSYLGQNWKAQSWALKEHPFLSDPLSDANPIWWWHSQFHWHSCVLPCRRALFSDKPSRRIWAQHLPYNFHRVSILSSSSRPTCWQKWNSSMSLTMMMKMTSVYILLHHAAVYSSWPNQCVILCIRRASLEKYIFYLIHFTRNIERLDMAGFLPGFALEYILQLCRAVKYIDFFIFIKGWKWIGIIIDLRSICAQKHLWMFKIVSSI